MWPRTRLVQVLLFLLTVAVMSVAPIVNHFGHGKISPWPLSAEPDVKQSFEVPNYGNKDYPLWYYTGRVVVEDAKLRDAEGRPWLIYPRDPRQPFPFMYPPCAALFLAVLSLLGPTGMLFALIALNAMAVAVVIELSVWMVAGTSEVSIWLRILPAALSLFFLNDMFLLGQPNLGLLGLMLGGLMLARRGWGWWAGFLFALATAIKAFPVVVIVYLVYRRYWVAAASMVVFTLVFFLLLPGLVRGPDRTLEELRIWSRGMIFSQGQDGIGQRPAQSVSWKNQSIFGLAQRLLGQGAMNAEEVMIRDAEGEKLKRIDAGLQGESNTDVREQLEGQRRAILEHWQRNPVQAIQLSPFRLDFRSTQLVTYGLCAVLGFVFIAVMPPRVQRTRRSDAAEFGLLLILMTIGTPYTFGYYFVWMLYPFHVLVQDVLNTQLPSRHRRIVIGFLVGIAVLYGISAPVAGNIYPMAWGGFFWAAMLTFLALIRIRFQREPQPQA